MLMPDTDTRVPRLVEQGRQGNNAALEQLIEHFYGDIFRMVFLRVPVRMDAEDVTQDVFAQMIKSLARLKEPEKFKSWLFRLALNRVRDFHRRKRIAFFFGSNIEKEADTNVAESRTTDPLSTMMQEEFQGRFREFSKSLPTWEREFFILRFMDNFDIREITQILNKNENTVKTHLYRALKKFKNNSRLHALLKGNEA
jgi:RNA polymerase sigma-70 factor (ECF subfamily)